jgi:hypothetical protein
MDDFVAGRAKKIRVEEVGPYCYRWILTKNAVGDFKNILIKLGGLLGNITKKKNYLIKILYIFVYDIEYLLNILFF